jgi:hypothetical protein
MGEGDKMLEPKCPACDAEGDITIAKSEGR